ncbi:MAG: RNA-guided endonuclease TnpB family protein, partial [Promethearchaeota archaeon]
MQLVKQVQLRRSKVLEEVTFASKNLFNVATYTVRQRFFQDRHWIRYTELWQALKSHQDYVKMHKLCGSHPPQQVLKQVDRNFRSFFNAMKVWKQTPSRFSGRPKLPYYKPKDGRNVLYFTSQQCRVKEGYLLLTHKMANIGFPKIKTILGNVKGVRI